MEDIFLVGPKHSGKTSAGKALAALCSGRFIDLDGLIAERTGESPRSLYTEGPAVFRNAEAAALAALIGSETLDARIIAAGGGLIDNPDAIALLENTKTATPVYLDVSVDTAWERINGEAGGELPPFLKTENPRETHRALHERRAAAYRKFARLTIEAERKSPEEIAGEILERLKHLN
ncbi:MAG: shikimate kinase [Treponema sp.]|jgi:shikimate kinase|nr:shikimate kinase [Treponema sp.]